MIEKDLSAYSRYFTKWCNQLDYLEYVCMLSPNRQQYDFVKRLFPKAKLHWSTVNDWDLNKSNDAKYDLIIACNVFHYSPNPDLWFKNVLDSCRYFWIQDLIDRYRSSNGQLGTDGDSRRYSYMPDYKSEYPESFDLSLYDKNIISFKAYKCKAPLVNPNSNCLHLICFMRGFQARNNAPSRHISMILKQILRKIKWRLSKP